jgi:hypothetical protein
MLRLLSIGVLSTTLAVVPLSAQSKAGGESAHVRHVLVRGTGDAMEVEIQTSGAPASPDTQALTGPDRIVIDFPGMLPSAELRALKVNQGALKSIRAGLFFNNPPITRIVLDLAEPRSYQVSTGPNAIVVKLSSFKPDATQVANAPGVGGVHLRNASLASSSGVTPSIAPVRNSSANVAVRNVPVRNVSEGAPLASGAFDMNGGSVASQNSSPVSAPVLPQVNGPEINVSYENGLLRIHADKVTLAQVLFEVQQKTQAEIAIPSGAEQEKVIADLGPAPARDVLSALLNGSSYNFVFVGDELSLERVILTRR